MVYEDAAAAAADTAADDDSALNAVYILPLLILSYAIYLYTYIYTFVVRFLPFSPLGYDDDGDEYR